MPRSDATAVPTARARLVIRDADLASSLPLEAGDAFPEVFATSRMIALMEIAAARCLMPLLEPGELSVGVGIDVTHTAPTPLAGEVTAEAQWHGQDGKLHRFTVIASDAAGEVGRGTHTRAIVRTERIVAGAAKRMRSTP